MGEFVRLQDAVRAVQDSELCNGTDQALLALGLRALLAAIGENAHYRRHYVAKGGTVLRLRSNQVLERFSTDLDLSGLDVEVESTSMESHLAFAADLGRSATAILRRAYSQGAADVEVRFDQSSLGRVHDESDPDTLTYGVSVSATLAAGKKPTIAKAQAYRIDLTCDEYIDHSSLEDLVVTTYGIPINVRVYAPIQSIAEKLRAILQKRRHFERGQNPGNWVPRHLFDLVPLRQLVTHEDLHRLPDLFRKKCTCRMISIDHQTRLWLLDPRLFEKAKRQDSRRAVDAWRVLHELANAAQIPA